MSRGYGIAKVAVKLKYNPGYCLENRQGFCYKHIEFRREMIQNYFELTVSIVSNENLFFL